MKRLLLVLVAVALLAPGAAHSAACAPINCAPSQFSIAGSLVGFRATALGQVTVADLRTGARHAVPGGVVGGHLLVHAAGRKLTWYDLRTGADVGSARSPWPLRLAGASQDGSRAVGFHGSNVVIVSRSAARQVPLTGFGSWDFDALRGWNLFLIKYLPGGGYQVVVADLSNDSVPERVLKDPRESGTIWGSPFSRLSSPDGRYLFTVYIASNGAAMVHELDLVHATARCIDLTGTGDYNSAISWAVALSPDGRTLWAANAGYQRLLGIDVASRRVISSHRLPDLAYWNLDNGTRAAVSPDGGELALTDGETVARIDLGTAKLLGRDKVHARAVGYAPDGRLRTLT